nr:immunoglobulin light chain junction region [Macaca mulatta]MPN87811.1 immunoglobulin light chain junction region [Macaca mulatta]
CMQVRQTPHSF